MEIFPERILEQPNTTLRPISEGAEKWLYRPLPCLDHGFVYLVDYMGNDIAVSEAARTSYGQGTKSVSDDRTLVRYLRRHLHNTPSEMVEVKFHVKLPIFVARQWIRHRTANVNEYSGRYSEMLNEFYMPDPSVLRKQSTTNRQGRGEELSAEQQQAILEILRREYEMQYTDYQHLLEEFDLARELARIGLSVANYTQWYWKIDLHNLFHFLYLRLDSHAQHEIAVYGQAMARIMKDAFPISYEAFEDYRLYAINFSRMETEVLGANQWPMSLEKLQHVLDGVVKAGAIGKREKAEFIEKLKRINFVL